MAKILAVRQSQLPPPRPGYDLVVWPTENLGSPAHLRSWAGWSESAILVGDLSQGALMGYTARAQDWPGTDLAVGLGKVWGFQNHYIAWLQEADLRVPEIARALSLAGVSLIIAVTSRWPTPFLDPLWRTVQANQLFGLALGPCPALYSPCELDSQESGVIPLQETGGNLFLEVVFERLEVVRKAVPIQQGLRPHLYKTHYWWTS